jgi:hypothetical protein
MELGISKFQGFFIDALMKKVSSDKTSQPKEAKKKRVETAVKEIKLPKVLSDKGQSSNPVKPDPASSGSASKV